MHQKRLCRLCGIILLMLQKSYSDQPLGMDVSNPWVNNGIPSLKLPWHLNIHPGKGDSYWKASFIVFELLVSGRVNYLSLNW